MELKKIHVGTVSYANEAMEEVSSYVRQGFSAQTASDNNETPTLILVPKLFFGHRYLVISFMMAQSAFLCSAFDTVFSANKPSCLEAATAGLGFSTLSGFTPF